MATIKCTAHPDCEAVAMCQYCGFLCKKHSKDTVSKKHVHILVNEAINDLYRELSIQEQVRAQSFLVAQIRQSIGILLDQEGNAIDARIKDSQEKIKKFISEKLGMNPQLLLGIIAKSLKQTKIQNIKNNKSYIKKLQESIHNFIECQKKLDLNTDQKRKIYNISKYKNFKGKEH